MLEDIVAELRAAKDRKETCLQNNGAPHLKNIMLGESLGLELAIRMIERYDLLLPPG